MSANSAIEWTDATWNPVRGCARISPGCENCYAERLAARFSDPGQWGHGFAARTPSGPRWTRKIDLVFSALDLPLHWKTPRRIFVNSTSDLFHESLTDAAIDEVTTVIAKCAATPPFDRHIFQVLTKRARRMRDYWGAIVAGRLVLEHIRLDAPLPNLWLGVSVENQEYVDERVPALIQTPAAVQFLSCEPLLGPIDLGRWIEPIDWVICGGESGPGARPMHPDWARSLRDQCAEAGIAFFMKQMTRKAPIPADLFVREFPHANA